jgi:hypothetical protein
VTRRTLLLPAPAPQPALSGSALVLAELRGDVGRRRIVDPGLAGGLREWLEDAAAPIAATFSPEGAPLVVTRRNLADAVLGGEPSLPEMRPTPALARGALVEVLFRQLVTTGVISDPMDDALSAMEIDDRYSSVTAFVAGLDETEWESLATEVRAHAEILRSHWPTLSPTWYPRCTDRVTLSLCGGLIILSGVLDLVVGQPSEGRASVCLVELKSGAPRSMDRDDLDYLALLETLRSGAPPFRAATFYSSSGVIDAEEVTERSLVAALQRTVGALARLAEPLSKGVTP